MPFAFTPAAERAIDVASHWCSAGAGGLDTPEMLIGLLAEPECRAALMLASYSIDATAVRTRWPELAFHDSVVGRRDFSDQLLAALNFAEERLWEHPRPLELATEHILLGLVGAGGEVSAWLQQRGLDPAVIEGEVHRLAGHTPGPLEWEDQPAAQTSQIGNQVGVLDVERNTPLHVANSGQWSIGPLRIADAAANRAGEGLRVIEDYLRFVLDDRHLTSLAKRMRHELTDALAVFARGQRHTARETLADVGTEITAESEQSRSDLEAIVVASFKRLQQSLRSLEEIAKLQDASPAARFEQLRYDSYTLERAVDLTRSSRQRLADARLYVLIDGRESEQEFRTLITSLVHAGVHMLQLRDKKLADRVLVERARAARELTRGTSAMLIINDRPDIAALAHADGVHVGQDELSVKDARSIVGPDALVGVSTHSIEQARQAVLEGANYIGVGPTFPSETKQFTEFPGLELLRKVSDEISLPAFAIGGIDKTNIRAVLETGTKRVAVSGAVASAADPGKALADLHAQLKLP